MAQDFFAIERQCLHQLELALQQAGRDLVQTRRLIVAYSGGVDSSVLLKLLQRLKLSGRLAGLEVLAVYINHGLSDNAERWGRHCQAQCQAMAVDFVSMKVQLEDRGQGLEAQAREARYQAFSGLLQTNDCLLTAHHQDDQAETVLLRLMRGSGPKGLGAMALQRPLGRGLLIRPLLQQSKASILDYAEAQGLEWIEDESNQTLDLDRNYLRLEVMPVLEQRWPGFAKRWGQSAELCQQLNSQLESQAAERLEQAGLRSERLGTSIDLECLQRLSSTEQNNVLRQWLQQQGYEAPSLAQLQQFEQQFLGDWSDQQARVATSDQIWARYQGRMYSLPKLAFEQAKPDLYLGMQWSTDQELTLPGAWVLQAVDDPMGVVLPDTVQLSPRQPGQRCQPKGRSHSQSLKKLLQERQLEPWLRPWLPLLWHGEQLLAVGDLWLESGYQAPKSGPKKRLCWLYRP